MKFRHFGKTIILHALYTRTFEHACRHCDDIITCSMYCILDFLTLQVVASDREAHKPSVILKHASPDQFALPAELWWLLSKPQKFTTADDATTVAARPRRRFVLVGR